MKGITLNELLRYCEDEASRGNGDKVVLISNDDEGNGFHTLFYPFTNGQNFKGFEELFHDGQSCEDVIVLG